MSAIRRILNAWNRGIAVRVESRHDSLLRVLAERQGEVICFLFYLDCHDSALPNLAMTRWNGFASQ